MSWFVFLFFLFFAFVSENIFAQGNKSSPQNTFIGIDDEDHTPRIVSTAVPFLMISPDARGSSMGDVGAATTPDVNAAHWNPAKLAFINKDASVSMSYTPWLAHLIHDMSISHLSGFYKLTKEQAVGIHLRYFDLGSITFTQGPGMVVGEFNPHEFAIGGTYSRVLVENTFGIGISARYVNSNLNEHILISNNDDIKPGKTVAADIGAYYNKDIYNTNSNLAFGVIMSNLGAKISYSNDENKQFIPTNLRLGSAFTTNLDPFNSLTLAVDFNKLMAPTPPAYEIDSTGSFVLDANGNKVIAKGKDPDRTLLSGMFGSFLDAPGGFAEELKEVTISIGGEYWYDDVFAARIGYFNEHVHKGNRKFFTFGLGLRYQVVGLDFAYLVPTRDDHPLAETLRFSLMLNWEGQQNRSIQN